METDDFLRCLSCGKKLGFKPISGRNQCTDCLLKLEFKTEDLDYREINKYLQGILNFFVSDVMQYFHRFSQFLF